MKANDNFSVSRILLPIPTLQSMHSQEMEIYARFMRHLRYVPNSKDEIKILSSIHYVADVMRLSDEEIAHTLVQMGLRCPRAALPDSYLDHADNALMRESFEIGSASKQLRELQTHWNLIGEDKFAAFKKHYPSLVPDYITT